MRREDLQSEMHYPVCRPNGTMLLKPWKPSGEHPPFTVEFGIGGGCVVMVRLRVPRLPAHTLANVGKLVASCATPP